MTAVARPLPLVAAQGKLASHRVACLVLLVATCGLSWAAAKVDAGRDPCDAHMASDLGWLQQYVQVGFFTDFRTQVWHYYLRNATSYAFLWLNAIAFGNLDFVQEACPEAAQMALLLRAEERLPLREAELPLLDYSRLMSAQADGDSTEKGALWPLALGVERLRRMASTMAVPREYSVDIVMAYCDEPLDDFLSRRTGYDHEWLSAPVPLQHVSLILYRLRACGDPNRAGGGVGDEALAQLPPRAVVAAKRFRRVEIVPVQASPSAWEAARYLSHLAGRYDRLADFTLFLHPDVFEHVNPRTLRNVLQALLSGTLCHSGLGEFPPAASANTGSGSPWYEYLSLSHHYLTQPSRTQARSSNCTDAELGFNDLKRRVLGQDDDDGAKLGTFGFYCCSQFMVHRDRVRRRAREWYQRVSDSIAWEHCATSYMEVLWHAVFNGGHLHEEKRQERLDLPLFLRVDNFLEGTSEGLV